MTTKVFALLFVLCLAIGSKAQLDKDDQVIVYKQSTLPDSGNVTAWENSAKGASGVGDLVLGDGTGNIVIGTCGTSTFTAALFDGSNFLTTSFASPINIKSSETVVVLAVVQSESASFGKHGLISTSNEASSPWSEGSVGPGIYTEGTEYFEDAESATESTVAGTSGIDFEQLVALGFVYTPNPDDTTDDYVVINGPTLQFFTGTTPASVQTSGAFATLNVGLRATSSGLNFKGCVYYLAVYISSKPVDPLDVGLTVAGLAADFGVTGGGISNDNSTTVPSASPKSRTTTTGRGTTTTGRRGTSTTGKRTTTTTGRKGTTTTGRRDRTSTTGVSAASLPFVAPAIQAFFLVLVSAFLFFMW